MLPHAWATPQALNKLAPDHVLQCDVSDQQSIERLAAEVAGITQHVDLLINNAGVYGERSQQLPNVSREIMLDVFTVNTLGPLFVTQALFNKGLLGGAKRSVVANVTSKMGSIDDNTSGGTYAYRASKAALNICNKSMSLDLEPHNITTALLHPGWVRTDMVNMSGLIDTDECVAGLLRVIERGHEINGRWFDYAQREIKW